MQQACSIFSRCVAPQNSTTTQCSIRFTKQSHSFWPTMCLHENELQVHHAGTMNCMKGFILCFKRCTSVWCISQHLRIFKWIAMEHNVRVKAVLILGLFSPNIFLLKASLNEDQFYLNTNFFYIVLSCNMNIKTALYLFVSFFLNHKNESIILLNIHNPSIEPSNCDKHFGHNCTVQVW